MSDAGRMARDIAKQLDRRQRRRKLILVALLIAAIIAAVLYFGWGRGWGFGAGEGKGEGAGPGPGSALATTDAGPRRCAIRVTAEGISVDGAIATQAEAVAACKAVGSAEVVVTGDARQGVWDELRAGLEAANVAVFQKGGAPLAPADAAGSAAPGSAAAPAPDGG